MVSNDHEMEQLLRAFVGLKQSQPIFYDKMISHIALLRENRLEGLVTSDNDTSIFRAQGYCQALKELLDYMAKPEDAMHEYESGQQ